MNLADILKDSNYKLAQFTAVEIEQLEQAIILKTSKSGEVPYTTCLVRQKAIKLTPEETIRQLYLRVLIDRLQYPLDRIQAEVRESRKAREQSKQLLEIAKTGVECAIKTDEATTRTWINNQLKVLSIT
jgi:hypothetical protein